MGDTVELAAQHGIKAIINRVVRLKIKIQLIWLINMVLQW